MPRHTTPLPRRLADRVTSSRASAARAAATVGLTTAALLVGVGGYAVTTSPVLATAPGDRFSLAEAEVAAPSGLEAAAAARAAEEASRAERAPLAEGLPATSAEAQSWVDEVGDLQVVLDAKAAEEEAARVAAEKAAAEKKAAEEEAARVAAEEEAARAAAEQAAAEQAAADERAREEAEAARSADRGSVDPGSNRGIAQSMLGDYGWGGEQWSCLDQLWQKESGWNQFADNPSSSAYGIPQALPGSKMSSAGSDWETNPATQIRWGLGYIDGRYGSPCAAWQHSVDNNWY